MGAPVTDLEAWDCPGACSHEHCLVYSECHEDGEVAYRLAEEMRATGLYVEVDGVEWVSRRKSTHDQP